MASFRQFLWDRYTALETAQHRLLYLFLEVTRACNLSCRHCGSDCGADDRSAVLSLRDWREIVDRVAARFSREVTFVITGGEPLVWPHLAELGEWITRRGRAWGLVTNGMALSARRLARLEQCGLGSMTISLDGDEAAHNFLRGNPDAYRRALAAIRLAGASSIPLRDVVTCVYPGNLDRLATVAETLLTAGIPAWRLFRIFPLGRARNDAVLTLDRRQTRRMVDWIKEHRPRYARRGLRVDFSCEGWFPFSLDRRIRSEPFFCRSGINIATIRCDGVITGCDNNGPAFFEGNIFKDDFAAVWENGFARLRRREWMRRGICRDCRRFRHCRGGAAHLWGEDADGPAFCYVRE